MTKHKLILDDDYAFLSYGISCHLKDFRVAWSLNKIFGFNFMRGSVEITDRTKERRSYPLFRYSDQEKHLNYVLVSNFSDEIPLVLGYKEFDFLMLIEGSIEYFDEGEFLEKLNEVESLQFVSELDNTPIQKFQFSLFEN